jgi:3-dehydroquinate synthase
MVAAGQLAVNAQLWSRSEAARQDSVIQKTGLPTVLPKGLDIGDIVAGLALDKKVRAGKVRFILPEKIGRAIITDRITSEMVETVLAGM